MGIAWAFAWSAAGFVVAIATRFAADAPFPIIFGVFGFIGGLLFSAILVLTEGRRAFNQMSVSRFAVWGALGGVVVSTVFSRLAAFAVSDVLVVIPTFAIASAVCAAGSLALARRAGAPELTAGDPMTAEREIAFGERPRFRGRGD